MPFFSSTIDIIFVIFKKDINLYLKSYLAKKLTNKLINLILIC